MNKLFRRAKEIYQQEGFSVLLCKIFKTLPRLVYEKEVFRLKYEVLEEHHAADFLPKIGDFIYQVITCGKELDELIARGYDLSLLNITQAKYRLEKGAVLSLILADKELAYRGWMALTQEAKNTFNDYPYKVNFHNGEVCGGDVLTYPKYRRQGLHSYAMLRRQEYFIEKGGRILVNIIRLDNAPAQDASAKHRDRINPHDKEILKKARCVRILGLKFWKESPIDEQVV